MVPGINLQGESRISVEDYAVAMLDELVKPAHSRQRFTVADQAGKRPDHVGAAPAAHPARWALASKAVPAAAGIALR